MTTQLSRGRKAAITRRANAIKAEQRDLEVKAEEVYRRIEAGELPHWEKTQVYSFGNDDTFPGSVINILTKQKRIKRESGGSVSLSSPEEYAAEKNKAEHTRAANRRARLDRWSALVKSATDQAQLDAALVEIANETMSLGSVSD